MKKLSKVVLISLMSIFLILGATGCNNENENIVATYDGGNVTEEEFNKFLNIRQFFDPSLKDTLNTEGVKADLLNQYIAEKYLLEQANPENVDQEKATELFNGFKTEMINYLGSEENYNKTVSDLNVTEEELINYIAQYYAIEEYFVEKRYAENKESFTVATVSHILVSITEERTDEQAKARAEEVLAKAKAGGDFAALAKEYSDDPGSKDNGGTYSDVAVSSWVPEFKEAALTQPLNEISDLVKTDYGYHIIRVDARSIPELDQVQDQDKQIVLSEEYTKFLSEELPKLNIEISLK